MVSMKMASWLLWLGCQGTPAWQEAALPIDRKVETALELMHAAPKQPERFRQLFVPSGYVVIQQPNGSETWLPGEQFLLKRRAGVRYRLLSAKVIHFRDIRKDEKGGYTALATVYFDVRTFRNGLPVTNTRTEVRMPVTDTTPDSWRIYELKVKRL